MDLDAVLPNNLSPKKTRVVDSKPKQDAELPNKIASTQSHGLCHDKKSEQLTFSKKEKVAVLLFYLLSKHTQPTNYRMTDQTSHKMNEQTEVPLQQLGTHANGSQQLVPAADYEGATLASKTAH